MSANSKIEWTTHTFNPWRGCAKVSPGCANCYAEKNAKRNPARFGVWGPGNPRVVASESYWRQPLKWNREAKNFPALCGQCGSRFRDADNLALPYVCPACHGTLSYKRPRVFSASLADWLDDDGVKTEWRVNLLQLIHATPCLDWLLLTKRPQLWERLMDEALMFAGRNMDDEKDGHQNFYHWLNTWVNAHIVPDNVWIGTTVEDQVRAQERIPELLKIPAKIRFLSCEPLLGPVDLAFVCFNGSDSFGWMPGIHWVICGGESGPRARPMHLTWARDIRAQCAAANVPFFFKQWGEWGAPTTDNIGRYVKRPLGTNREYQFALRRMIKAHGATDCTDRDFGYRDNEFLFRIGKKAAGRLLDGIEHNAFPAGS